MELIYQTALFADGESSAPMIWCSIHNNAVVQFQSQGRGPKITNGDVIDVFDKKTMAKLGEFDAGNWQAFCASVGWTVYGAVALSWCREATLEAVLEGWLASGFPLKPSPEFERPARFINPDLLPKTNKLSDIIEAGDSKNLAICVLIAALEGPLEFDMSHEILAKAPPQIATFLKSRMLKKTNRSAEEEQLISAWSAAVSGTEFDVWKTA